MGPGGTERVVSAMANHWAEVGRAIRLVNMSECDDDFYPVDPRVERVGLGLLSPSSGSLDAFAANARRVIRLRRAILGGRPDAVISFGDTTNCLTLLAALGTTLPVVVSERSDPRRLPIGRSWATLRRWLYPLACAVVVQTDRVAPWARELVPEASVHVIPNFVQAPARSVGAAPRPDGRRRVTAVGRLSDEKGFDLLLRAFARCVPRHTEWSLVIAGEGPNRAQLEAQAAEADLASRVHLPGLVRDLDALLASSDLFVLSSRFEGFPNALLEAMSAGVAPIAFDCDSGPATIIRNGLDGVLVRAGDVDGLAREMDRLMRDDAERARLGREARAVRERFALPMIVQCWERLVDDA